MTNSPLATKHLVPNITLRKLIYAYDDAREAKKLARADLMARLQNDDYA